MLTMVQQKIDISQEKVKYVKNIFSDAAKKYDLLNDILSGGLHRHWKRHAVNRAGAAKGSTAIDICSGTMDMAILLARKVTVLGQVVALDFSQEMLDIGLGKAEKKGLGKQISSLKGDATDIDFPDNTFDSATVGFGLRNVSDLKKGLSEMLRVIKPGSKAVILEFSTPSNKQWRKLYDYYSFNILPKIGGKISSSQEGYEYLPDSIRKFPKQEDLKTLMEATDFINVSYKNLTGGIVAVHVGEKTT